jgi:hypothetical protein
MPRTRIAHTIDVWEKLTQGVDPEELADSPSLLHFSQQLRESLEEIQKLSLEQSYHEAQKRAATRRITEILEQGRITANAMKAGLRLRHGNRNAELLRYGIRPFHRRKKTGDDEKD